MVLEGLRGALRSRSGRESPQPETQEQWPPLPDDAKEVESMEAWPKGVIAFDVVIDKQDVPYILEIQGLDAGVTGIQDLESADLLSDLPTEDGQLDFWIDASATADERNARLQELAVLKVRAGGWKNHAGGYSNPNWFAGRDGVSKDKREQVSFIPEENRPETVVSGNFEHLFQKNGKVIVKPPDLAQGAGIHVFGPTQKQEAQEYAAKLHSEHGGFVAQRFIQSRGADLAPADLRGHAQSLRLVVPFHINNGQVEVDMPKFGYQRVARYSHDEAEENARVRGVRVSAKDASVVNRSLDAAAVPMSDAEYNLVLPVALSSIKRLTDFAKTQPEHLEKVREVLSEKAEELRATLDKTYNVYIQHLPYRHFFSNQNNYADNVRAALENTKQHFFFLRFLEREFRALPQEVWQSKAMEINKHCRIVRIPNSHRASIELLRFKKDSKDFSFNLKNENGADATGSLKLLLEEYVKENSGLLTRILAKL